MATISERIAWELVRNDGCYEGDPQAFAVIEYYTWDGRIGYAVVYDESEFERYARDQKIIRILWHRQK